MWLNIDSSEVFLREIYSLVTNMMRGENNIYMYIYNQSFK